MVDEMYQVLEVWFPYYRLKEAGLEVNFVAAEAKKQAEKESLSRKEIEKLTSRGLDWLAKRQSRSGHWGASQGRYPTAMTSPAPRTR